MEKAVLLSKKRAGMSYADIARECGVSRQRIQQRLGVPQEIRNYIIKKYKGRCAQCGKSVGKSGHIHHKALIENYEDIDNLILLCQPCHKKNHSPILETVELVCFYCHRTYEKTLNSFQRRDLRRNKRHFCSRHCHGQWFAENYGMKKGDKPRGRMTGGWNLGKTKYNPEEVLRLYALGYSGIKIAYELNIPESTIYCYIRNNKNKKGEQKQ